MIQPWELILEVPAGDFLGEGVVWDDARGVFLLTGILGRRLHRMIWPGTSLQPCRFTGGSVRLQAGNLIAAFNREIGWLVAVTGDFIRLLVPDLPPGVRLNDGRVGPDGSFWVGSRRPD